MADQSDGARIPDWISAWYASLEEAPLSEIVRNPEQTIVASADMIVGFCDHGALASGRVARIVDDVRDVLLRSHELGVSKVALLQDAHDPEAREFAAWPPHCVKGTAEAETIAQIASLPLAHEFAKFPKNSLAPGFATSFDSWLDEQRPLQTAIVIGNCTDLCVYALAMHLRLRANAEQWPDFEVVVPANCVDTYDLGFDTATKLGVFPHPGDLYHQLFLHHMALNGIRVVAAAI